MGTRFNHDRGKHGRTARVTILIAESSGDLATCSRGTKVSDTESTGELFRQTHKSQTKKTNNKKKQKQKRVTDHLMIFRSKLNNHLFYSLKCPHGGTAKYTQNEG